MVRWNFSSFCFSFTFERLKCQEDVTNCKFQKMFCPGYIILRIQRHLCISWICAVCPFNYMCFHFKLFNPLHFGRLFQCNMLDKSICHFRGFRSILSLLV